MAFGVTKARGNILWPVPLGRPEMLIGARSLAWTELFLAATGRACRDADRFVSELVVLEERARAAVGSVRRGSATDLLIRALPALPVFTAKTAAEHLGRSRVAVNEAIARLENVGVIRKITLGRRNRAFEAVGLFEAFTGFERILASPDANTYTSPPVRDVLARPR